MIVLIILGYFHGNKQNSYAALSLFCLVCVSFRGKRGAVCGKRFTFLYTSPYEHVQYNVPGP